MAWGSCYSPDFRAASIIGAAAGTTALNDRRLCEGVTGTPTFVSGVFDTGRYVARLDASAGQALIAVSLVAAAGRYSGGKFRYACNTAFTTNVSICRSRANLTTDQVALRVNTTGAFQYSTDNGTSYTNIGVTAVQAQVYRVELFVDHAASGVTKTIKIRIDGIERINTTFGTVTDLSDTFFEYGAGAAAASMTAQDFSDMVTYNDAAQYGIMDDWRVIGLEPLSDGAHSMTASDFQDASAANLSNSTTTSWAWVDDAPTAAPTVTDFVQQVVTRATSYMEWLLRSMPAGYGAPVLVCLAAGMHPVGAALANTVAFRLNSGGNLSAEAAIDTSIATNTLEFRKHHYPTEPSTAAAWTTAMVQAPLRARFGYSSDASPPPALDAVMAFVVAPVVAAATLPPTGFRKLQAVNRAGTY